MSRFLYYLIFVNMLAIITTPVPRLLLIHSTDGAIISMIVSVLLGVLFTYITVSFFTHFNGQDMIMLLDKHTANWVRIPVTLFFAVMWFIAGTITLIMTVFLLITFLTPEMSIYIITLSILVTVFFGILLKTKSVLFTLEIVLILMIPIGLLMFFKLFTSNELDFDQIRLGAMHVTSLPNYSAVNSSLFMFMGSANLIIYNKYFKEKQTISKTALSIIAGFGVFMLITSYFVPIGLSGFDQIDDLIYPWTSSADAVRMKYGIVERVVFIFMFLFVTISFVSIVIHWHVAYRLLLSLIRLKILQVKQQNFTPLVIAAIFCVLGLWITANITQHQLYQYASYYYNVLPLFCAIFFFTLFAIKRGAAS